MGRRKEERKGEGEREEAHMHGEFRVGTLGVRLKDCVEF